MTLVAIVDYGLCNLDSIRRAVEICGSEVAVSKDPNVLDRANHLILPGVGAFGIAMRNLHDYGLAAAIRRQVSAGIPLLGVCLGMQVLVSRSEEGGDHAGLGFIPGEVVRLNSRSENERIPHIGWNSVEFENNGGLLSDIQPGTDFYFLHSYHCRCADPNDVVAITPYCGEVVSVVRRGHVFGTQFHPEKSQKAGLRLLANFLMQ